MNPAPVPVYIEDNAPLDNAEILTELILPMVDHPEVVRVEEVLNSQGTTLLIYVSDEDRGRVIGTKGANINLLRNLFAIYGARQRKRITIEVAGDRPRPRPRAGI